MPFGYYDLVFDYVGAGGFADQVWPNSAARFVNATAVWVGAQPLVRDITLPRGASIGGAVRNFAGAPISGVEVIASALDPSGYGSTVEVQRAVSGADGRYAFDALPPADYKVQFWVQEGYSETTRTDLTVQAGDVRTDFDATMYRYTRLSGSVICSQCGEYQVAQSLVVVLERNVGTRAEPAWVEAASNFVYGSQGGDRAS